MYTSSMDGFIIKNHLKNMNKFENIIIGKHEDFVSDICFTHDK